MIVYIQKALFMYVLCEFDACTQHCIISTIRAAQMNDFECLLKLRIVKIVI